MKELQAKAKVTQTMTRDGLVVENQADGTVENVSCREAEQDYSTDAEGKAEKILERAEDIKDGHKNKKKAKKAAETAATAKSEDGLHRSAARLELTEDERADPALQPFIQKAEAKADKLDSARAALPKKRVPVKKKVYDAASGKAKSTLRFEQQDKGPPSLKPNPASRPIQEAGIYLHGKIHEVEQENVGVEAGHLAERGMEKAVRYGNRKLHNWQADRKLKPWRDVTKAEQAAAKVNADFYWQKSVMENPQLASSNPISRLWQKKRLQKQYAAAHRAGTGATQAAGKASQTAASAAKKGGGTVAQKLGGFVTKNKHTLLIVGGIGLMLMLIMGLMQSCTSMFGGGTSGLVASSYLSEDADLTGAEAAYCGMEAELQEYLDTYESTHDYDEYHFDLDEIEHDPYVLLSILSALHEGVFTLDEVQGDLEMLFDKQYILTETVTTETRYRTETRTDSEGNEYEVEVPYTWYICTVTLENFDLSHVPVYIMGEDQLSMYAVYMSTLGNRPDLFPSSGYVGKYIENPPTAWDIPAEYLTDERFATLITEAEKYLGYPYVWGGSSPETSFDCSGFVSYVLTSTGLCNTGRLGAQGLYNISTPVSDPQPGDLVFFVGTYDTPGVSHVGIYVGDNMMLHCGDPISYTNLNTSYWQSHFYAYGRPPYN